MYVFFSGSLENLLVSRLVMIQRHNSNVFYFNVLKKLLFFQFQLNCGINNKKNGGCGIGLGPLQKQKKKFLKQQSQCFPLLQGYYRLGGSEWPPRLQQWLVALQLYNGLGKYCKNVLVFRTEVKFLAFYNKGLNCDPWKLCGYSLGITNLSKVSRCMNRCLTYFFSILFSKQLEELR